MRMLVLAGLVMLGGCGGGGRAGTNYSDPPPMAEIVATPSPRSMPAEDAAAVANVVEDSPAIANIDAEAPANAM
ncbi:hypothetical protein [Sphingomonas sp. dw_22]|uniref:hypothetical protein n=1 Tax=Sphingomonas sp. dw_22 TaxID=2721175 RepID=UPI001BD2CD11|nr:hypothetical protein [Sphingomonas sp. dw_22]